MQIYQLFQTQSNKSRVVINMDVIFNAKKLKVQSCGIHQFQKLDGKT